MSSPEDQEFWVSWYRDELLELMVEPVKNVIFLHVRIFKWGISTAKKGKEIVHEIEQEMAKLGYKYLWIYNPKQTVSSDKLISKFTKYPILFYLPNGHHVYGKDISCQHCL